MFCLPVLSIMKEKAVILLKNHCISVGLIELSMLSVSASLLFQGIVNLANGKCLSFDDKVVLMCTDYFFVMNSDLSEGDFFSIS